MIRIQNRSGDWFTLPPNYIPVQTYNFKKDAYLYRNTNEVDTHLLGDQLVAPDWIEFQASMRFEDDQALSGHIAELTNILDGVVKVEFGASVVYLNFGYVFVTPTETTLDVDITLRLAPVLTRFGVGNRGQITWGSVDVFLGDTDITFAD